MTTLLDVQGRRTVGYLVNKSGGAVVKGDAVIVDASNDEAFVTSTAGAEVVAVGIVAEDNGIANNANGRIVFSGYVDLVTVSASVTRGHFGKTHTVAKQVVDAGTSRVVGVFLEFLKSGTTPSAWLFGLPDGSTGSSGLTGGTPALTLGTSNAAGSASTGIRTDATIALFDATAPVTQAFSDAAAVGAAGVAARRDHKHGMPASPGGGGSLVTGNILLPWIIEPLSTFPDVAGLTITASESFATTPPYSAAYSYANGWLTNGSALPQWWKIQLPLALICNAYALVPWFADNYPGRALKTWTFEGSNDGSSWTTLDTQTNYTAWATASTPTRFSFTNTTAYLYYRVNISAVQTGPYTGIGRIWLWGPIRVAQT